MSYHLTVQQSNLRWWYRKLMPAIECHGTLEKALKAVQRDNPLLTTEENATKHNNQFLAVQEDSKPGGIRNRLFQEAQQRAYLNKLLDWGWEREREAQEFCGISGRDISRWLETIPFQVAFDVVDAKLDRLRDKQLKARVKAKAWDTTEKNIWDPKVALAVLKGMKELDEGPAVVVDQSHKVMNIIVQDAETKDLMERAKERLIGNRNN